jgi:hypothetical protein
MFGWDFGDDRPAYRGFAEKSGAALRREHEAIAKFDALRKEKEGTLIDLVEPAKFPLLTPKEHLTGACYTTFRRVSLIVVNWMCVDTPLMCTCD